MKSLKPYHLDLSWMTRLGRNSTLKRVSQLYHSQAIEERKTYEAVVTKAAGERKTLVPALQDQEGVANLIRGSKRAEVLGFAGTTTAAKRKTGL